MLTKLMKYLNEIFTLTIKVLFTVLIGFAILSLAEMLNGCSVVIDNHLAIGDTIDVNRNTISKDSK